jgi:hypothetical protein
MFFRFDRAVTEGGISNRSAGRSTARRSMLTRPNTTEVNVTLADNAALLHEGNYVVVPVIAERLALSAVRRSLSPTSAPRL